MKKRLVLLFLLAFKLADAKENFGQSRNGSNNASATPQERMADACLDPAKSREFWINNIRMIVFTGGDMWWDKDGGGNPYYIIPATQNKADGASSLFAGAIWLAGLDGGGQLKVAAMTYRQNGIDFWTGPLNKFDASVTPEICAEWDRFFYITRKEVDEFVATGKITSNIQSWPGNGDVTKGQDVKIAPYVEVGGAPDTYDPDAGDYPAYDVLNKAEKDNNGFCKTKLYGDETLFWIFNDKGGIHRESKGIPIGVEVRAQAFAFRTNDEINNMTFYSYEIFNRSSFVVNQTYFAVWNDADLGGYTDDYVGCDISRGLGYMYNANATDPTVGGSKGYGDFPPAVGCDFFRGPLADPLDGIDNDQDGIDETVEAIGMSKFLYYNNNIGGFNPNTTNPDIASHYYGFMTGFWKDNTPFTEGGNAYLGSIPTNFVYNGDPVTGIGWTERTSGNLPGDRRFIQSAGPFTLKPGAVNYITFGMPWAQAGIKGGNLASITLLRIADDKAQALFNNCFKILDGPEAPDMTIQEMDRELIIYLSNKPGSNNFNNQFEDEDPTITPNPTYTNSPGLLNPDKKYRFEGYKIYQLRDERVNSEDLFDVTKAKLVAQYDIANGVTRLTNYVFDGQVNALVPKVMVDGDNKGMRSTVKLTEDAFATGNDKRLINSKTYYYMSVAYAYNNFLSYRQDQSPESNPNENYLGQKKPYLEGRKVKRAGAIPHITDIEKNGTTAQASYGYGPKITRIEGQGNGGNFMDLTAASENAIVANNFLASVEYENNAGPIKVKVVDPLRITPANYTFRFISAKTKQTPHINSALNDINTVFGDSVSFELKNTSTGQIYFPNNSAAKSKEILDSALASKPSSRIPLKTMKVADEYYFEELGLSIELKLVADPSERVNKNTDFAILDENYDGVATESYLGASMTFDNPDANWLTGVRDADGVTPQNWILSGGNNVTADQESDAYYAKSSNKRIFYDSKKVFSNIINGTWAPYSLCSYSLSAGSRPFFGPAYHRQHASLAQASSSAPINSDNNTLVSENFTDLRKLSSVDIVFTSDQSKWTRCPVLEMQERRNLSLDQSSFFQPRKSPSVDKNGNPASPSTTVASTNPNDPNYINATGMGWFPGYAINIETGERLNMAFGEDSYQKENNGDDMMWNPTSRTNSPFSFAFGGKHFIYVFGNSSVESFTTPVLSTLQGYYADVVGFPAGPGRYDAGARLMKLFNAYFNGIIENPNVGSISGPPTNGIMASIVRDAMWVNIPLVRSGFEFKNPKDIPTRAKVKIRVQKPYRYGYSTIFKVPFSYSLSATSNPTFNAVGFNNVGKIPLPPPSATSAAVGGNVRLASWLPDDVSATPQNNNFPMYSFNTNEIATLIQQTSVAKNALDLIRVVPNPYYGSSSYEASRIDNKVRITNLPNKCTIKIFTINGTLVRTVKRDVQETEDLYQESSSSSSDIKRPKRTPYEEWDLKNQSGIGVASGLYIIHIDAPGLGEKILKWFGVMRPLDLQDY
jgi:hypothetical protein